MRFRKKPVEIEALQWTGDNYLEVCTFVGCNLSVYSKTKQLFVGTLEGIMTADAGDWIIRGVKGEYYPCKPDIFEATYEKVEVQP